MTICLNAILAAAVCLYFYDKFWWPPDDGAYAYVADQINSGKILHRDIQDVHMGYINLINAAMLRWFGDDFVSLRLPLMVLTIIQALLIGAVLQPQGRIVSVVGALTLTSLSFVQFINPSANWYALFLMVLLIWFMQPTGREYGSRLFIAGLILANMFLFRQLSAVFATMACVSYLFYESSQSQKTRLPLKGRLFSVAVLLVTLTILCVYLWLKVNPSGILLFGIFPVILLIYQIRDSNVSNHLALDICLKIGIGFLVGLMPIFAYHIWNHSLSSWLSDTVLVAIGFTTLEFFKSASYVELVIDAFLNLGELNAYSAFNSLFWLGLLLAPAIYGVTLVTRLHKGVVNLSPVVYMPVFYMLVSVHYEIPVYLFYSISLVMIALLVLSQDKARDISVVSAGLLYLCGVGLTFQAGQPLARGLEGTLRGDTTQTVIPCLMEHCGVSSDSNTIQERQRLVGLIRDNTETDDPILAIPFNPELYYLSKRQPPVVFYNAAFRVVTELDIEEVFEKIESAETKILIVDRFDKYYTEPVAKLTRRLLQRSYVYDQSIGPFKIYFRRAAL